MDDFELELKQGFLDEAAQSLADTEQCFLALEGDPQNADNLNKIFRLAHNLKGSSKAVGFSEMGAFTHEFETFILKIKNLELTATPAVVNLLLRCNDHLTQMVVGLKQDLSAVFDSTALLQEMVQICELPSIESTVDASGAEDSEISNVESSVEIEPNLDLLAELELGDNGPPLHSVETVTPSVATPPVEMPKPQPIIESKPVISSKPAQAEETLRISVPKLENLLNFIGEMVILQSVVREQVMKSDSLLLKKTVHQMGKVSKEIQDVSMSLRMVPVKTTFQKMQRIVRDTAMAVKKDVAITLVGEETELDKTVLEKINDPLVHLIRNSVDHGIEATEARLAVGKSAKGNVTLSAFHESGKLVIEVKDDGAGLNPEKLKRKAIEKGILKPDAVLTEKEAFALIFAPGFSTKEAVTDVSGRGVGMDVVKTNIHELSGEIHIDSKLGRGTTFRITLPLTLAIIDGMILTFANEKFVVPLNHVHETLQISENNIKLSSSLGSVLLLRGENLPIYRLGDFFAKRSTLENKDMIALVVRTGPSPFAILVDDILGQYQVVVKQLGPELQGLKGISGSTILGDGKPALILEPTDLLKRKITSLGVQPMPSGHRIEGKAI
jgi:two-component system, chemotaxis family, sensor kinase CheA